MTRERFLLVCALRSGCGPFLAKEAVATTLLAHPEWDPDEVKTYEQWSKE